MYREYQFFLKTKRKFSFSFDLFWKFHGILEQFVDFRVFLPQALPKLISQSRIIIVEFAGKNLNPDSEVMS